MFNFACKKAISEKNNAIVQQLEARNKELDRIAKLLVRRDFDLMQTRAKREEELQELKKLKDQLENAKSVLEIKVKARTSELKELAQGLEEKVKQRTEELRGKLKELERMNDLMVGREMKMIELKKELKALKKEPSKKAKVKKKGKAK